MSSISWDFGDLVDEAAERAGIDPAALTHRHLNSITRSLQLLFIELETKGANAEFRMETQSYSVAANAAGVVLDSDTIDVTKATLTVNGAPYPLGRSTREDFLNLSYPTSNGNPTIFFLMKTTPGDDILPAGVTAPPATKDTPVLVLWPQNGLSGTIAVKVTRIRQHAMPSAFGDALDTRRAWLPTMCAGLASHIARKYNPAEYQLLKLEYEQALFERDADEDMHPVKIGYRGHGWGRERRH